MSTSVSSEPDYTKLWICLHCAHWNQETSKNCEECGLKRGTGPAALVVETPAEPRNTPEK